ncbi:MAG: galactokinase [Candidatus Aminicenantales bacterium]
MDDSKIDLFSSVFHTYPQLLASAPGRINIIGEHTDYNSGYVLPAAIHLRTYFLAAPRPDKRVRIWADDFQQEETFDLETISPSKDRRWANYVKGIFWVLSRKGCRLGGADALIWGKVPLESGLSSSAALEVSVIKGLSALFGIDLPGVTLAEWAQKAENDFVGVQCGLMDQFISVFGKKDHVLFLDCETLDFTLFPLRLEKAGLGILVYDTRVRRTLASSEYNRRRQEAAHALDILRGKGVRSYKEATRERLEEAQREMDEQPFKRARHVITENERVLKAVEALQRDDFSALGDLLFRSHESLRDDYEVSCPELDLLHDIGKGFAGCLGARLVGAGFGGSGIALLEKPAMMGFRKRMMAEAAERGFPQPEFHEIAVGEGANVSRLDRPDSP